MSAKKKKIKKYLILFTVFVICYHGCSLFFIGKEQIKLRWEAKELLFPIYLKYGYRIGLGKVTIDKERKIFQCVYDVKRSSLYKQIDKVNKIRRYMESYLEKHKDYFLNENYEFIIYVGSKQGERIVITNRQIFEDKKSLSKGLKNVDVRMNGDLALLEGYVDIISLRLGNATANDVKVLKNFVNLKYIAIDYYFIKEDIDIIHKLLPNCQIKHYSDANVYFL